MFDIPSDSGNIKPFQVYLSYNFVGHVERALAPHCAPELCEGLALLSVNVDFAGRSRPTDPSAADAAQAR
jgi:hypothetical protein